MTRIHPIALETAPARTQQQLQAVGKQLGMIPNLMKTMANSPSVLTAYLGFSAALAGDSLEPALREQLSVAVAQANHCDYCLSAHTAIGKSIGLTDGQLAASRTGIGTDAKSTAALKFALKVLETRGQVADSDLAAVRAAGFNDAQVSEIVAHVALNVLTNYFNNVAGTEVDFPKVSYATAS
jgi:uncharacterized peroxidase-related enzyme